MRNAIKSPVLYGLGHMAAADCIDTGKICNRARHPQDAVIGAC